MGAVHRSAKRMLASSEEPIFTSSLDRPAFGPEGRRLDAQVPAAMEARFGFDFSRVRVHSDPPTPAPAHGTPTPIVTLQRGAGNRATSALIHRLRTESADGVLRRREGKTCAPGTCDHDAEPRRNSTAPRPAAAPPHVHQVLGAAGEQLHPAARSYLEPRFGHDFSMVRVHTDATAVASAEAVGARAYTVGNHLAFAAGAYAPHTEQGRRLIAHELAHTLQQGTDTRPAGTTAQAKLIVGEPDHPLEREADHIADQVMRAPTPSGAERISAEVASRAARAQLEGDIGSRFGPSIRAEPEHPLTVLQPTAGNLAVTRLVAQARLVQRQGFGESSLEDFPTSSPDDGSQAETVGDNGKPATDMTWTELQRAIDEHERFIAESTETSPAILRAEQRLAELKAAQVKLGSGAHTAKPPRGRRRVKAPRAMPPKPESLSHSIDLSQRSPDGIRRELDLVVAYLAAGPAKAERVILEAELPTLEAAAGEVRVREEGAKRAEHLSQALASSTGDEGDQLLEMLSRVQAAQRDPTQDGIWLIPSGGYVFPLSEDELVMLHDRIAGGLLHGALEINNFVGDIELAWKERDARNKNQWIVHGLVKFATGVDDISASEIRGMVDNGNSFVRNVRELSRGHHLVDAGRQLLTFDRYAKHEAQKVGEWEAELVRGAGRWVIALTVLKESLAIMAGFEAARLATAAGGGFVGTLKAGTRIAAMTTGTGLVAGAGGSVLAGRDVVEGGRLGAGAGFGVGATALTAGVGKIASVKDAAKATGYARKALAVGKAVGLETGANVLTSSTQAAIEGRSVGKAALGAAAMTPINVIGGAAIDKAAGSKATRTIGKAIVGVAAGTAGAAASDQDLVKGALVGGGAGMYGSLASPFESPPVGGRSKDQTGETGSAGPTVGAATGMDLPAPLAELQQRSGVVVTSADVEGGVGWKLVKVSAGDEFEAFGLESKTSFKWAARVPEENWTWARRGNQLVPEWYTGRDGLAEVMVRYRIKVNQDVTAAMSKVADQKQALERLGPAKFQYYLPEGFERFATIERIESVAVLIPGPRPKP